MKIWAILPAAGVGRRMGSSTPKQYLSVSGTPVLLHSINRLLEIPALQQLVVVLHPQDSYWSELNYANPKVSTVAGGEQRFNSVLNGLDSLAGQAQADDWVLVHDAVRPCVTTADISNLIEQLRDDEVGGLLGTPIDNTVKQVTADNEVVKTVNRSAMWSALTPQMFRFEMLHRAINAAIAEELQVTDEASAIEALGYNPRIIPGLKSNIKITHETDLKLAEFFLACEGDNQ